MKKAAIYFMLFEIFFWSCGWNLEKLVDIMFVYKFNVLFFILEKTAPAYRTITVIKLLVAIPGMILAWFFMYMFLVRLVRGIAKMVSKGCEQ